MIFVVVKVDAEHAYGTLISDYECDAGAVGTGQVALNVGSYEYHPCNMCSILPLSEIAKAKGACSDVIK